MDHKWMCKNCKKPIVPNPDDLRTGDKVNYTVQSGTTKSIRMSARSGVIQSINGDDAIIETKGKLVARNIRALTPDGAPSPLTFIFGACKCKNNKENQ